MCVQRTHRLLSSADTDTATKRVAIEVTIVARRMRADWSSWNYPAEAYFRFDIMKVMAHKYAWVPAGTFG